MNIAVIGTGYVGLVSGVCFAEFGFSVTCLDNDSEKITSLKNGVVPIYEPSLDKLMKKNSLAERLHFTTDVKEAVQNADVVFIAVGTPSNEDGSANLYYVFQAIEELSIHINRDAIIVVKSTVPVGTTAKIRDFLRARGIENDVAFNPEFLKEGAAIEDFMRPDRVILGIESKKAKNVLSHLYRPLYVFNIPIVFTNLETAELSKYSSNAFLAMKVTFINEIADLCEKCGADVNEVALSMGLDKRIGDKFLQAGPGYGGSCFPKDTSALCRFSKDFGVNISLVEQTVISNNERKNKMVSKIFDICNRENLAGKNIAILGVTFKANTDDMRESPSINIINALIDVGANIKVYDPSFSAQAAQMFPSVKWSKGVYEGCKNADVIIVITDWAEFRAINLKELRKCVNNDILIDLRNIYSTKDVLAAGFRYFSIGRRQDNAKN